MFDDVRMFAFLAHRNPHVQMFNRSAPAPRAMAFYRNSCSKVGPHVSTPSDLTSFHDVFLLVLWCRLSNPRSTRYFFLTCRRHGYKYLVDGLSHSYKEVQIILDRNREP